MMIVAHDGERYGYLSQNGKPIPPEALARRCGAASLEQYLSLLAELDAAGVPRRSPTGIIYSKRMVDDDKERAKTRDRVRKFRKTQDKCNARVTPSVTPLYEDENETVSDVSDVVFKVWKIFPSNSHRQHPSRIEQEDIMNAIVMDGKDLVLTGTMALAERVAKWPKTERKFIPNQHKFFTTQEYLADPVKWEKSESPSEKCSLHPNAGLTSVGTCWDCYAERHSAGAGA